MKNRFYFAAVTFVVLNLLLAGCQRESTSFVSEKPDELTFELNASVSGSTINADITPSSDEVSYYIALFTEEEYDELGSGDSKVATWIAKEIAKGAITENDLVRGCDQRSFDGLSLGVKYYIASIGVYADKAHGYEVRSVVTNEWEDDEYDCHIKATLSDIDVDWADVDISVDDDSQYYLAIMWSENRLPLNATDEYIDEYIANWLYEGQIAYQMTMPQFLAQLYKEKRYVYKGSRKLGFAGRSTELGLGVYVCAISEDAKRISKLQRIAYKSTEIGRIDYPFEIDKTVDGRSVTFDVKMPDKGTEWYIFTMEHQRWEEMKGLSTGRVADEYIFELQMQGRLNQMVSQNPDKSFDEIVGSIVYKGDASVTLDHTYAETDYVYVIGTVCRGRTNIFLSSTPEVKEFKTGKIAQIDANFGMTLSNIGPFSVDVAVTPSDKEAKYAYACIPFGDWGSLSDQEILENYVSKKKNYLNSALVAGDKTLTCKLIPDTEYVFIAFGYQDGGTTTPLAKVVFDSPKGGDAEQLNFNLNITSRKHTEAIYDVRPSTDDVYWCSGIIKGSTLTPDLTTAIKGEVLAKINKNYDDQMYYNKIGGFLAEVNWCIGQSVAKVCDLSGKTGNKIAQLNSNTDYLLYAIAVKTDGTCASEPVVQSFKTPQLFGGPALINARIANYYYPAQEATFIPGGLNLYNNYVVVAVEFDSIAEEAVTLVYQGDTDAARYTDEELFEKSSSQYYLQGRTFFDPANKVAYFTTGAMNSPSWFLLAAKDENGVFGNLVRVSMSTPASGALSIDALRTFYEEHNGPIVP